MVVTLTWPECELAAFAGMKRQLLALFDKRPDVYGFNEGDKWGTHIESCASELAVARAASLPWIPWARRPHDVQADVGNDVQVRRRGKRGHHLLLHDADRDDQRFVLVSGLIPTFQIHGWIYGHDGKTAEFFGDPYNTGRPCFWVPQDRLEPFDTFTMERALTA